MRTKDRDRDRILRPAQLKTVLEKFKIPVIDLFSHLERKFEDKNYPGNTNYENLVQYLIESKTKEEKRMKELRDETENQDHEINRKMSNRRRSATMSAQQQR